MAENWLSDRDFKRLVEAVGDEVEGRLEKIMMNKFELIGINVSTAESREAFREKMAFLTGMKTGAETMKRGALKRFGDAIAGGIIAGFAALVGLSVWGGKPPVH